jgi:hypothetical protein
MGTSIRDEQDRKRVQKLQQRILRAMKASGLRVESPPEETPYGTDFVIDGVPSLFFVDTNGYWAPPGGPLKVVFGSVYSRRRRLTIRERKSGFDVQDIVGRIKVYLTSEKEYVAQVEAKDRSIEANRKLVEKLTRKLKIDQTTAIYLYGTGHETPELVALRVSIEKIKPADVERVVGVLRREVPDLLVERA